MKQKKVYLIILLTLLFVGGVLIGRGISQPPSPSITKKPPEPSKPLAEPPVIRRPAVAGQFYPGNKRELRETVNQYLKMAKPPKLNGELVALIAPHAGYVYSGKTAGYAFKLLEGKKIDTIILIGGSHYSTGGVASVFDKGAFRTPLGDVVIDHELAEKILHYNPTLDNDTSTHRREHSLEVELPFLQTVLPDSKIVPILIKSQTLANAKLVAQAIVWAMNGTKKKVLIVASTDMSHYFPRQMARMMDDLAINDLVALDTERLNRDIIQRKAQLCGRAAVLATLIAAKNVGANKATKLHYSDSGDASGDTKRVVGYVAMALTAANQQSDGEEKMSQLDEKAQKKLLEIAKETAISYIKEKKTPQITVDIPILSEKWGAFVTINKNRQLRGCIGRFTPVDKPLYLIVQDMAVAACSQDPRFPPINAAEIAALEFEISVLSPMQRIKDVNEIQVGEHGIYIIRGFNRGVLLPQVATEYGWDRTTFLQQTCRKAGLPPAAWRDKETEIYTFTAQIIHESKD